MCCSILPEARKCQEGWRSTLSGGSHLTFTQETGVCVPPNTINHFLNPKIWLWTWNRIWAAVCISIRAGGNELWRITHRHIETVRFNVRIRIVIPPLQSQSDGWKFIKGCFQSMPLDITKFTERWKPIGDKDSMHSIISSLHFYWFARWESSKLTYPPGVGVFFFPDFYHFLAHFLLWRTHRKTSVPALECLTWIKVDQGCILLNWRYRQAPSHQMTDRNDHYLKIALLGSIKEQMSHEGWKLHFNLISTTHLNLVRT